MCKDFLRYLSVVFEIECEDAREANGVDLELI
jgi:hypothetical protein